MKEFLNILSIAIALSMDTFSLSLSLGTYNISYKKIFQIAFTVGLMHFLMPLFGDFLGEKIITFFSINSHIFLGCILLFLAFNLLNSHNIIGTGAKAQVLTIAISVPLKPIPPRIKAFIPTKNICNPK